MKLISARQAWHDALHENRSSVMAVAAEQARLGKKSGGGDEKVIVMLENENGKEVAKSYTVRREGVQETRGGSRLTESRCAHMLVAGLIMQAIDTLPKSIRHLGHFLYSPLANGNDLSIAHALAWLGSGLDSLPERKRERAYWMAMAALQDRKAPASVASSTGIGMASDRKDAKAANVSTVAQPAKMPSTGSRDRRPSEFVRPPAAISAG